MRVLLTGLLLALCALAHADSAPGVVLVLGHTGEVRAVSEKSFDAAAKSTSVTLNGISWKLTYLDVDHGTGIGFGGSRGGEARAAFQGVLAHIGSVVNHPGGVVELEIQESLNSGTGYLGSGGSLYFTGTGGFFQGFVQRHMLTGVDPAAGYPDGTFQLDFGRPWHFDIATPPPPGEFDFFSVVLHELTHAMGFVSLTAANGTSRLGTNVRTIYDQKSFRAGGSALYNGSGGFIATSQDLIGANGGVIFNDAAVTQVFGRQAKIFTPPTFSLPSSMSHLDLSISGGLMLPALNIGERRDYLAGERAMLQVLGYSLKSIPPTPTPLPSPSPPPLPELPQIAAAVLGISPPQPLFDVNQDGIVDVTDAVALNLINR